MKKYKALAMFSGGLDSMLATKLITSQNIEVIALNINIGFASKKDLTQLMQKRANIAGAEFKMIDARELYIKNVLFSPKFGYGKHFNPCIDCHGFMLKNAKKLLKEYGASFIITGEVIGQRPMSQRVDAMGLVKKLAEDEDNIILRPLSAKLLEPTKAETKGWVNREKLLGISGRNREMQLSMAKQYGWEDFEKPGGGCLLTDANIANRIKDFIKYDTFDVEDIDLIKFGRHLRLPGGAKLVIGRNEEENEMLSNVKNNKMQTIKIDEIPAPLSLIGKNITKEDKNLSAKIILTFTKADKEKSYKVMFEDENIQESPFESRNEVYKYFV